MNTVLMEGRPDPLGSHWDGNGVNFSLFSENAEKVELCVFKGGIMHAMPMPQCSNNIWHGYLEGAKPGLVYAYRVYGESKPGNKFKPQQLLLDPYARELAGDFSYQASDSSAHGLRCVVVDEAYDWEGDVFPNIPMTESVMYEVHVKGMTCQHPDVPKNLCGTYGGLSSPAMIEYFQKLGVTALSLLPVHYFVDEARLLKHDLTNYWGYNTLSFFAVSERYASKKTPGAATEEFRSMVKALHAAGIEVILDVVFNHTAETDELGPTISFRGIDNASYYLLPEDNPNSYINHTGCGNTLNLTHPNVLQMVMDSLRYWVTQMHVDGFRFDLAATLVRDSAFLAAIHQDPILSKVKLIAEPWDLGPYGYQLGRFNPGWSEWNDRFRDDVRAYWLSGSVGAGALAQRLAGSSEIFKHNGRAPQAGVNFITAHDGFSLRDLVSYQDKHNQLNGEGNRDGHSHNLSWNCGVEGETHNQDVLECRKRLQRALLATLLVAQGVPMLQAGDELGRTQSGNNNAYCQDNPMTWIDWSCADQSLISFTSELIALRKRFPQLSKRVWLDGRIVKDNLRDITWWHPEGREMSGDDWHTCGNIMGFLLSPDCEEGELLLVLFNRGDSDCSVKLPQGAWEILCASEAKDPFARKKIEEKSLVSSRSFQLLVKR